MIHADPPDIPDIDEPDDDEPMGLEELDDEQTDADDSSNSPLRRVTAAWPRANDST